MTAASLAPLLSNPLTILLMNPSTRLPALATVELALGLIRRNPRARCYYLDEEFTEILRVDGTDAKRVLRSLVDERRGRVTKAEAMAILTERLHRIPSRSELDAKIAEGWPMPFDEALAAFGGCESAVVAAEHLRPDGLLPVGSPAFGDFRSRFRRLGFDALIERYLDMVYRDLLALWAEQYNLFLPPADPPRPRHLPEKP